MHESDGHKGFYIKTFGCQMNEQDSLRMADRLSRDGYSHVPDLRRAHLVLVNTCSIREKAQQKAYSFLGRLETLKRRRPETIVACAGCVAQQEGQRLRERFPFVDLVVGPSNVASIVELLEEFVRTRTPRVEVSQETGAGSLECEGVSRQGSVTAYVTIMEGCNNFCSYCVVPYVRGRERSRPYESIRKEIENLVRRGVKEVCLLGQNVNSYRCPETPKRDFPELLHGLRSVEGLQRVRFTTSHPKDLSQSLIDCYGKLDVLCEHIHLPLQSGSDRVLSAMNRGYTFEHYLKKIDDLRRAVPEIGLSTDIIVGFPGEDDRDFESTVKALEQIEFDTVFSFAYSARPGTRAALLQETISETEKNERLRYLQECQARIAARKNARMIGSYVEVLVEGTSRDGRHLMGRTRTNKIVNFEGPGHFVGCLCTVQIVKACKNSLMGRMAADLTRGTAKEREKIP